MALDDPPPQPLSARVKRLMGRTPTGWRRATGGYTTAERWVVTFDDGHSYFVKSGRDQVASFLRAEYYRIYSHLQAPFLPELVRWDDDGSAPILVLEDLSHAHWPPPWNASRIQAVLQALKDLQACSAALPDLPALEQAELLGGWPVVESDAQPFLRLGLSTEKWLTSALPALKEAAEAAPVHGHDILHFDVRSDNLCFLGDRVKMVDWNHLCRANRELDVAAWLPSLHSEGGPPPEGVYPLPAVWPALISGYFAARAGLPPIAQAPLVRTVQLSQLRAALPWAQRALGLPPLDGPNATS